MIHLSLKEIIGYQLFGYIPLFQRVPKAVWTTFGQLKKVFLIALFRAERFFYVAVTYNFIRSAFSQ